MFASHARWKRFVLNCVTPALMLGLSQLLIFLLCHVSGSPNKYPISLPTTLEAGTHQ